MASTFKKSLKDYISFFKNAQGAFLGEKKTYIPLGDSIDEPKRRGNILVQTTVAEKLKWFQETVSEYIDALFSQEATNASGIAKAELVVEGKSWGELTSLELLRLKSILENGDFKNMYGNIPVRSDQYEWSPTVNEEYNNREIFELPKITYENKTTIKESYILPDPNIEKSPGKNYTPQIAQKTNTAILGNGTQQIFSGEWSHRQRAEVLRKIDVLHTAVVKALKKANDVETVDSTLNAEKLFNYLHG